MYLSTLIRRRGVSSFGIKVSRPGYDVKTASDPNLIFSSEFNTLKEYRVLKLTGLGGGDISEAAHGLSYPPTFIPFRQYGGSGGDWQIHATSYFGPATNFWVDDTKVYAMLSADEIAYVMLFIDPLNE